MKTAGVAFLVHGAGLYSWFSIRFLKNMLCLSKTHKILHYFFRIRFNYTQPTFQYISQYKANIIGGRNSIYKKVV